MLKNFLVSLTLLLSLNASSQSSWINIQYLSDNYPSEINWELLDSTNTAVIESDSNYILNSLLDTTITLDPGTYVLNVNDIFGDGLGASLFGGTDGWFLIQNDCQDTLAFVAGDFGTLYTETLTIAPCAPPTGGCLDSLATNYNGYAAYDDGSCIYAPCIGLDTFYVETYCTLNGPVVNYTWDPGSNQSCNVVAYTKAKDNPNDLGIDWYPYPANWSNTGITFSNADPYTTYYFIAELGDGSYTDTLEIFTDNCIIGCMDSLALNWNPWANTPDGTCTYPAANCANGQTNVLVILTPDTYVGETSWEITDTSGTILQSSPMYTQTGVPVVTETCIADGTEIIFTLYDNFGDGMCGSCYGGVDGSVVVETLCGDTLLSIQPGNADFGTDTTITHIISPCITNVISGCMDENYLEFDPLATIDDSSCTTLIVLGCTEINSINYDPSSNTMANVLNCDYEFILTDGAGDGWFGSWIGVVQNGSSYGPFTMDPIDAFEKTITLSLSSEYPVEVLFFTQGNSASTAEQCGFKFVSPDGDTLIEGGTNPWTDPLFQFPYRYSGTPDCGNFCIPIVLGCMDSTSLNYNPLANTDDLSCMPIILGCTNPLAFNYDSLATLDDLSCIALVNGCMDSTAYNYNSSANTSDGSCIYLGCTDIIACNYDVIANVDNGGCTYPIQYYDCLGSCLSDIDGDGICDDLEILGCTDPLSINFDPTATDDDNTCIPYIYGCTDSTQFNYNPLANTDDNTCIAIILGCTDPAAFNYDVNANTDDNTCVPVIIGCMDITMWNYNATANTSSGNCIPFIYGCTDSTSFNYDPIANTDNSTCVPFVYGCSDNTAFNFDPLANTLDNSCCYISGCTDIYALNYNSNACYDDNSCIEIVSGCTDVAAYNYNSSANVSDSLSCLYNAGCYGGPGIPYWLNDGCYAWVIDVDDYCCTNNWDASCQSMYNYCQLGWPTAIDEINSNTIIVYPNPTTSILNIDTHLDIEIKIYNMTGALVYEGTDKRINIAEFSNGVYNLTITYNKMLLNKRIIKQ